MIADYIAERLNLKFKPERFAYVAKSKDVLLLKLRSFMNLSGETLNQYLSYNRIPFSSLLVLYDDIDFDLGLVKLRWNGGSGGHNGVTSIIEVLGTSDFWRIRLGVRGQLPTFDAKEAKQKFLIKYLLSPFSSKEKECLLKVFEALVPCIHGLLKDPREAMNQINRIDVRSCMENQE
jgi:PTH1 family peptidyl-tRNA hydrolase